MVLRALHKASIVVDQAISVVLIQGIMECISIRCLWGLRLNELASHRHQDPSIYTKPA